MALIFYTKTNEKRKLNLNIFQIIDSIKFNTLSQKYPTIGVVIMYNSAGKNKIEPSSIGRKLSYKKETK
jgi:hypothetical protein